jgi:glycosyltransferase involved in cell wall biosynthesis
LRSWLIDTGLEASQNETAFHQHGQILWNSSSTIPIMISFIVPAHNEELCLPRTLGAINDTARVVGQPYELLVVDDASTDSTAEIARKHQATVIRVNHRHIAATRNSGAKAARGERLFFVDADTLITPRAVTSALRSLDKGAVGGGALTKFEGSVPLYAKLLMGWLGFFIRLAGISGGAFMFCTRKAFNSVGGFNEKLYGAEDAAISSAFKREGPFVVISERLFTSGRRMRAMSGLRTLAVLIRIAFLPSDLTRRSAVEKIWYNSNRADENRTSYSLAERLSNALAFLILLVLVTLPLWIIPWPTTLLKGPLGTVRFGAKTIMAHVSLVLWPCGIFLLRSLFQQNRWIERIKLALLSGFSLWIACHAVLRVYSIWLAAAQWLKGFVS